MALIVIGLGAMLAFLVKRYLGLTRITLELRKRNAELSELWRGNRRHFLATVGQRALRPYNLDADIEAHRAELERLLDGIRQQWFRSSVDDRDLAYQRVLTELTDVNAAIHALPDLGDQRETGRAARLVNSTVNGADLVPGTAATDPPAFATATEELLSGGIMKIDDVVPKRDEAAEKPSLAVAWVGAYETIRKTTERRRALDDTGLDAEQKTKLQRIDGNLVTAWIRLFRAASQADVTSLLAAGADAESAEIAMRQLETEVGGAPEARPLPAFFSTAANLANPELAAAAPRVAVPASGAERRVDDRARARMLRDQIRRGDWLSFWFAFGIALLTGLNQYYLGQPFGSLKDYVGLFLWAAGTKAVLDIVGAVVDKFFAARQQPAK